MVLAGDVELLPDGTANVGSASDSETIYHVNGSCPCADFPRAPEHQCKHRLAYGIHKRAMTLTTQRLDAKTVPAPPCPPPPPPAGALPEAPASVNCYLTVGGRQCQVTLRDTDETRLLARLDALLARFPASPPAEQGTSPPQTADAPEGWRERHQVPMRQQRNQKGTWWSHRTGKGWCKGR